VVAVLKKKDVPSDERGWGYNPGTRGKTAAQYEELVGAGGGRGLFWEKKKGVIRKEGGQQGRGGSREKGVVVQSLKPRPRKRVAGEEEVLVFVSKRNFTPGRTTQRRQKKGCYWTFALLAKGGKRQRKKKKNVVPDLQKRLAKQRKRAGGGLKGPKWSKIRGKKATAFKRSCKKEKNEGKGLPWGKKEKTRHL